MHSKAILLALSLTACVPSVPPEPPVVVVETDAAPPKASDCKQACANLHAIGCPEGEPSEKTHVTCETFCAQAIGDGMGGIDLACAAAAPSKAEARACKGIRCRTF